MISHNGATRLEMHLPNTTRDRTGVMDANELIASGCNMEVRLFFVHEKCVRHPNVLNELGADW